MAKKGYLVVVPVNKPAYMKAFKDMNAAGEIIRNKVGYFIEKYSVDAFDAPMVMLSAHISEKSTKRPAVNDRATYYAQIDEDKDVLGPAIIIGDNDGFFEGLDEAKACKVMNEVNDLSV